MSDAEPPDSAHQGVWSALGIYRNRWLVRYIDVEDLDRAMAAHLAEALAAHLQSLHSAGNDVDTDDGTDGDREPVAVGDADRGLRNTIYVNVVSVNLPALDASGVLAYDEDTKHVERGPRFEAVASGIRAMNRRLRDADVVGSTGTSPGGDTADVDIGAEDDGGSP